MNKSKQKTIIFFTESSDFAFVETENKSFLKTLNRFVKEYPAFVKKKSEKSFEIDKSLLAIVEPEKEEADKRTAMQGFKGWQA